MNAKHTPGPWEADLSDPHATEYPIHSQDRIEIATVWHYTIAADGVAETQANARLIAAAPEMYEAIKHYCEALYDGTQTDLDVARYELQTILSRLTDEGR